MARQSNSFEGFVLAGGKSSRMGTDKENLKFGGETFLERAARTLAQSCGGKVRIVLNANQIAPENHECVRDIFTERGALGGIHAALKNCESEWAIILAVDLPFVTVEAIGNLQHIALASTEFSAIVPKQSDGRLQPLCAAYLVKDCLLKIEEFLIKEALQLSKKLPYLCANMFRPTEQIDDGRNAKFVFECQSPV